MRTYNRGDRVVVKTDPNADYTWIAAWGQKGTVTQDEGSHGQVFVAFDSFKQAEGGWFHPEELEPISLLDKLVEDMGDES